MVRFGSGFTDRTVEVFRLRDIIRPEICKIHPATQLGMG